MTGRRRARRERSRPVGIWSRELRFGEAADMREGAAELEELGFGTLWIPGGFDGPLLEICADQLGATRRVAVATGILNVFGHDPADVAREQARIDERFPGPLPARDRHRAREVPRPRRRPSARAGRSRSSRDYLDELDRHAPAGTAPARAIAALAPRMVQLARERTLGIHPYMVPVEHTAEVRAALGAGPLVATELSVVLGRRPSRTCGNARATTSRSTSRCRTTSGRGAGSATARTTSPTAAATGWSMRSTRSGRSTGSASACASTSPRAPITSACASSRTRRCSARTSRSRAPSGVSWPPLAAHQLEVAAGDRLAAGEAERRDDLGQRLGLLGRLAPGDGEHALELDEAAEARRPRRGGCGRCGRGTGAAACRRSRRCRARPRAGRAAPPASAAGARQ